jgi:hypothetical protein
MTKQKLTYFDFHGGRGEPARLALSISGIPFEDDRVPPSEMGKSQGANDPTSGFRLIDDHLNYANVTNFPTVLRLVPAGIEPECAMTG